MMDEQRAAIGNEWTDLLEVLHGLSNMITVRGHYAPNRPAIAQADAAAHSLFARIAERIPELVVALVQDEFVICERPLPDLRSRIGVLADAMNRHQIECIVFQKGMTAQECALLGQSLSLAAEVAGSVRERTQQNLRHVLLRFVATREEEATRGQGLHAAFYTTAVEELLVALAHALAEDRPVDKFGIHTLATQMVASCTAKGLVLQQRSWSRTIEDEAAHAANVAMMTAMMTMEAGYPNRTCVDATAAALVHDVGHLLLPAEIRGIPEPLLDERAVPVFRNHTFAGAAMLLGAGCSPLWVAAAFEHHRGIDGKGYPELESKEPPHELVRIIALANFFDRKRTLLQGRADTPEDALLSVQRLEKAYFGEEMLKRFLRSLGVYPPGTTVELSDRQPAVVTRANAIDPWRPQVRMLRGPMSGKHVELRSMSLAENRHELSIVRSIPPPLLSPDELAMVDEEPTSLPSLLPQASPELGGMDAMLEALMSLPTDALVSPPVGIRSAVPPPAPSSPPMAMPSAPPAPLPVVPTIPPNTISRPPDAVWSQPPSVPAPAPSRPPHAPTSTPPPIVSSPPPTTRVSPSASPPPRSSSAARPMGPIVASRPPPTSRPTAPIVASRPPPSARPTAPIVASRPPPNARPTAPAPAKRKRQLAPGSVPVLKIPAAEVQNLGLDPRGGFILSLIDGQSSLESIIDASAMPESDVFALVTELVERGVLAIE